MRKHTKETWDKRGWTEFYVTQTCSPQGNLPVAAVQLLGIHTSCVLSGSSLGGLPCL